MTRFLTATVLCLAAAATLSGAAPAIGQTSDTAWPSVSVKYNGLEIEACRPAPASGVAQAYRSRRQYCLWRRPGHPPTQPMDQL